MPLSPSISVEAAVRCDVAAWSVLRGSAEEIAHWRKQPVAIGAEKLPVSFLKHADEQTVLALTAVRTALDRAGWQSRSFADWGVIAAPNFLGRISNAGAIQRYQQEGAWGVLPNLIPHLSLHAVSGTISQALKIHGPNFGVGGGANAGPDAFLLAAAMMTDRQLPGLWIVLTGYETEWLPSPTGPTPAPMCQAVVLALTPLGAGAGDLLLSIGQVSPGEKCDLLVLPEFSLACLSDESSSLAIGKWRLADAHWLELEARP